MDMTSDSPATSTFSSAPPAAPSAAPPAAPRSVRLLRRTRHDKVLGGVCGGIARYTGVDPVLVRVLAVALAVFTAGTAILAYLITWIVMPREAPQPTHPAGPPTWPSTRPTQPAGPPVASQLQDVDDPVA